MERSRTLLAVGAVLLAAVSVSQSPPRPDRQKGLHPLLDAVYEAAPTLRFAGVREVTFPQPGGKVSKFREKVLQDGRRRRIEYAPGGPFAGHISVDDGQVWLQYNPETKEIRERPSMGDPVFMMLRGGRGGSRLGGDQGGPDPGSRRPPIRGGSSQGQGPGGRGQQWQPPKVEREASQKVAGLEATVLVFKGQQDKVFTRMWIEPKRKMVLKSQAYGPDGRVFGGFEYVALKFDPQIPSGAFTLNIPGTSRVTAQTEAVKAFKSLKMPQFGLAANSGWRLTNVRKMDTEQIKFVSLSYAGKGDRVTLFVISGKPDPARLKSMAGGRASIYAWQKSGVHFVLMGRLDDAGLKALSQKVTEIRD